MQQPGSKLLNIERGNTQIDVNRTILEWLLESIPSERPIKALDLPCGGLQFLLHLRELYPQAILTAADLQPPQPRAGIEILRMDLSREFEMPREEQFDLITCISGIMVFGNTLGFIENCAARLKSGGTFIVTNDNSMTLPDRLRYLFLGRLRMFSPIFEDHENVIQNVPIMELMRLVRIHGMEIERIEYTSFYAKDLFFLPLALLIYPLQFLYLLKWKSPLAQKLKWQAYPFAHLLRRHYIVFCRKK